MGMNKLVLALTALGLVASIFSPGSARADMSGDPGFCYVGWVLQSRYGGEEDAEGHVTQVQLGGKISVCPTDSN